MLCLIGRNIGWLSKSIKQAKHPGKHLALQYKRFVASSNFYPEESDQEELEEDAHPLVPLGAVCSTMDPDAVQFPDLTRWSSTKEAV